MKAASAILCAAMISVAGAPPPGRGQSAPAPQVPPASAAAAQPGGRPAGAPRAGHDESALLALARARTDAHVRLSAVELRPGLAFGHWIARDREADTALRMWIWSRPAGRTRVYEDGVVEVDVLLPTGELVERLRAFAPRVARGGEGDGTRDACFRMLERVPWLCGRGSARPGDRATAGAPPGWEDMAEADRDSAGRAAVAAAAVALLEQIAGERLTTSSLVREFLESDAALREAALLALTQSGGPQVAYLPHQAARAELSISRAELLRLLTRLHAERYRGTEFRAEHFRDFALLLRRERFRADGEAPPPSHGVSSAGPAGRAGHVAGSSTPAAIPVSPPAAADLGEMPEWAERPLRVAVPRGSDEAAVLSRMERAVAEVVLVRGVTLGQFVQFHPELRADYLRALSGACPVIDAAAAADEVVYEVPLWRVWERIRGAMMETGDR